MRAVSRRRVELHFLKCEIGVFHNFSTERTGILFAPVSEAFVDGNVNNDVEFEVLRDANLLFTLHFSSSNN